MKFGGASACFLLLLWSRGVSGRLRGTGGDEDSNVVESVDAVLERAEKVKKSVLVTGFEAFGKLGNATNPAAEAAMRLQGKCKTVFLEGNAPLEVCYEGWQLPVSFEGSSRVSLALQKTPNRWSAVIHLGYEAESKGLRLEIAAANVKANEELGSTDNFLVPCNKGPDSPFEDIVEGGPCLQPTTAPVSNFDLTDIQAMLAVHGVGKGVVNHDTTWSRDAGAYYCNDAYYRTLYTIRTQGQHMLPALFIHVPPVHIMPAEVTSRLVEYVAESILMAK